MPNDLTDPRFEPLKAVLTRAPVSDDAPPQGYAEAAVSLILRSRDHLEVLLIKRSRSETDPWSGHMALPGGKREAEDTSLLHTAVRETLEETGVRLGADGQHLGRLSRLDPSTRRLPPLTITPFVFGVSGDTRARAASGEVDDVFWVPLATFRDPDAAGVFRYRAGDLIRRFPAYHVHDQVVWGLTYRVLQEFLDRIEGAR